MLKPLSYILLVNAVFILFVTNAGTTLFSNFSLINLEHIKCQFIDNIKNHKNSYFSDQLIIVMYCC